MHFYFLLICIFIFNAKAENLDSIFNQISETEVTNPEEEALEEVPLKTKPKKCLPYNNANIQITNKTEGKTDSYTIPLNNHLDIDFLSITVKKCCQVENDKNYAFLEIQNKDTNEILFSGWMFSKFPSLNAFENSKFDITLAKCL